MKSKTTKSIFRSITGKVASHAKCAEYASLWANTFDSVVSIQICYDPDEKSPSKWKYAVFGQWMNGTPKEVTPDLQGLAKNRTFELIAERPMPDGTIMYYRQTQEDIEKLIEYLKEEGVRDKKLLTVKHWLATGNCKNKPASEGGGCKNVDCTGSCSYCEPGHYCCC